MAWKGPLEPWLWQAVVTGQEGLKREPCVLKRIGRKAVCSGCVKYQGLCPVEYKFGFSTTFKAISSVQLLSHVWLFVTPWTAARQVSLSVTNSQSPPKPMSIKSVMPPNHFIPCCPLLILPSILPSIRVFSNQSALRMRWPKYWSFSF